jgi:2,5-diketo-D-gluconate reductase A
MTIPTIDLAAPGGAVPIPALGFGVWQVADDEAERAVAEALRVGYRHVDTAKLYHNEVGTGRAVRDSGLAREDVFVTTKVWPTDFGAEATPAAFEASMDRLGLDVLDLLLLHWPWPHEDRYLEAYAALLALRATGRVRAVGVSNFAIPHLERVHAELGSTRRSTRSSCIPTCSSGSCAPFTGSTAS